jgi:Fic family protein
MKKRKWNWEDRNWPQFQWDREALHCQENQLLKKSGILLGSLSHLDDADHQELRLSLLCDEGLKSSEIEGEHLNRSSLQASLRRSFGLSKSKGRVSRSEQGIADLMTDLHRNWDKELTHKTLHQWHRFICFGRHDLDKIAAYRSHSDPMLVVSGSQPRAKIHFQAPPSQRVRNEMKLFINWFNQSKPEATQALTPLTRSGIAHLYFVSIHPYEDGNGRIARALSEKALSQGLGQATLISLSQNIQKKRSDYYQALADNNQSLDITGWLSYFAETVLNGLLTTQKRVEFLISKAKLYSCFANQLNKRQSKVISRIFHEGINGFVGGLSAENYLSITKTSRATATRDLQGLVRMGAFNKTGERKHTRYYLNL